MSCVRTTRIPMSSNRRTLPPPQAEPLPCEYVNIPPHNGMAPRPDPGAGLGGYTSTFKLLEMQDLQQQVTCIHSLVRWPRRASRTSKISKNHFFSQNFSKYLFLSQKIFEILWTTLEIFKKLRKESVNSEYLKISWNLSKTQKCMQNVQSAHFFYKIKLELSRHSCARGVCVGVKNPAFVLFFYFFAFPGAPPPSQKSIK